MPKTALAADSDLSAALDEHGYAIVVGLLDDDQIEVLCSAIAAAVGEGLASRNGASYAIRGLLECAPAVRDLARSTALRELVVRVIGTNCFAVRGILFDKPAQANWKVPRHQDLTIEVRDRKDVPGFGPWSMKADVFHVQPPHVILKQMIAVRIHLDDCGPENGPLRVIHGSHRFGRLSVEQMLSLRGERGEAALTARRGDAIVMRPLLVHASSSANSPSQRRVIHLEFANCSLPGGLKWQNRV